MGIYLQDQSQLHPAVRVDPNHPEQTPWLEPSPNAQQRQIQFYRPFLKWGARQWQKKFGDQYISASGFYAAQGDFRSSLINEPDKIESRWLQYEADIKQRLAIAWTAQQNGRKVSQEEIQIIIENIRALKSNFVDFFPPEISSSLDPQVEQYVLSGQATQQLLNRTTTPEKLPPPPPQYKPSSQLGQCFNDFNLPTPKQLPSNQEEKRTFSSEQEFRDYIKSLQPACRTAFGRKVVQQILDRNPGWGLAIENGEIVEVVEF